MQLLKNGTLIDGSGEPRKKIDILINGEFIKEIGSFPNINAVIIFILMTLASLLVVHKSIEVMGNEDHKEIVIDEILAMMLVAHFIPPDPIWAIGAFCVFRFFDIAKPYPINLVDKNMKNSVGIILDDLIAAAYSIILVILLKYLLI